MDKQATSAPGAGAYGSLEAELRERIGLNFRRLQEPYYQLEQVFSPEDYDWYGDKEGRAILAFACHIRLGSGETPCLAPMLAELDRRTNAGDYFGPLAQDVVHEQQLSGHSWYLRGLCEMYELSRDPEHLRRLKNIFEGLYLPTQGRYGDYPLERPACDGDVSGHSNLILSGWQLSSDVGCAFMSIDGLSHYYAVTGDERARTLLDEMIDRFVAIDKVALRAQTHCSLTAARGMLRLYGVTGQPRYLEGARSIFATYTDSGMTLTYQNLNWWGRPDTWTEPCAIVDSLIVAIQLHEITGEREYLTLARRIWHNGMASAQRPNGGAGTDSVVLGSCAVLQAQMYEAYFCCTMRLAEGLVWAWEKRALLEAGVTGRLEQDGEGRWFDGDILHGELLTPPPADLAELAGGKYAPDGRFLVPLVKYYRLSQEDAVAMRQRIL